MVSDRASLYIFHGFSGLLLITYDQVTSTDNADTRPDNLCSFWCFAINGFGTGLALKNGISTGGLDILGLTIRKHTGKSVGTINIIFNAFIVLVAGAVYGWPYAFYSALGILVNARVMDMVYTRQQKCK